MNIENQEKYLEKLKQQKNKYVAGRSSTLQPGVVSNILADIKKNYKLESNNDSIAILALLFQQGGTARSCDGNMMVSIFDKNIKLSEIRKILKQNSCHRSERKLARSLASQIKVMALALEVPGNLYNKIKKNNLTKTFTLEETVWLSDFQSDNEDCPIHLREYIQETFKNKKK